MSAEAAATRYFVDSNVWLYIFLPGQDDEKARQGRELVRRQQSSIVISTQVINEVVNGLLKHAVMSEPELRELVHHFYARYGVESVDESLQLHASRLRERYSLSHWDSLIVAAALRAESAILYSEDMQSGLRVEEHLTIVNPFS